jgi:hypothetical protein
VGDEETKKRERRREKESPKKKRKEIKTRLVRSGDRDQTANAVGWLIGLKGLVCSWWDYR